MFQYNHQRHQTGSSFCEDVCSAPCDLACVSPGPNLFKNSETDIEGPEPGLLQDGPSVPQVARSKSITYRWERHPRKSEFLKIFEKWKMRQWSNAPILEPCEEQVGTGIKIVRNCGEPLSAVPPAAALLKPLDGLGKLKCLLMNEKVARCNTKTTDRRQRDNAWPHTSVR